MKHIVLTRFRFQDKDLMSKYLVVMKKILIPSLNSQVNKNFTWGLLVDLADVEMLRRELQYDFTPFKDIESYFNYVKENGIQIQTRHDCDDFMSKDYIKTIQDAYKNSSEEFKKNMIIHFQATKIDFHNNLEYNLAPYSNTRNSMFLSLCQDPPVNHVLEKKHGEMFLISKNIITFPPGYVKLVIHGNNKLSRIHKNDVPIKK